MEYEGLLLSQNSRGNLHSKRVEKMENYTPNEWRRWKTTLETGREYVKVHSKRVEMMLNLHSKRVEKMLKYTRNE